MVGLHDHALQPLAPRPLQPHGVPDGHQAGDCARHAAAARQHDQRDALHHHVQHRGRDGVPRRWHAHSRPVHGRKPLEQPGGGGGGGGAAHGGAHGDVWARKGELPQGLAARDAAHVRESRPRAAALAGRRGWVLAQRPESLRMPRVYHAEPRRYVCVPGDAQHARARVEVGANWHRTYHADAALTRYSNGGSESRRLSYVISKITAPFFYKKKTHTPKWRHI
mmetsp:Transcript_68303/g.134045  ORF Transcript_68303/g.134045 Transcript_68303/m.134045 type:complete len:223 (+) Transcript_68303:3751-4419(+)